MHAYLNALCHRGLHLIKKKIIRQSLSLGICQRLKISTGLILLNSAACVSSEHFALVIPSVSGLTCFDHETKAEVNFDGSAL